MSKPSRILYLPSIHGQLTVWRRLLDQEAAKADIVFQFGNIIGIGDWAIDGFNSGPNMDILHDFTRRTQLDKWTQLIGPNEILALNSPETFTNKKSDVALRTLWMDENPRAKVAVASNGRLLSHGGLTYGEWLSIGKPTTAEETAALLNEKYARTLYQGPCFKLGDGPNYSANPIWSHISREVCPSWLTAPESLPFDQVTGGGSLNSPEGRSLADNDSCYKVASSIRYQLYGSNILIKGQRILSLDFEMDRKRFASLPKDKQIYVELLG